MKTKAAVLHGPHKPFEIMELDLDAPGPGEVLIKYSAAGLCHSDLHLIDNDLVPRFPIVGGHEGAGVIEDVGPGVTKVKPGDHVVCSFIPSCGTCRYCSTGRQNLCDMGASILQGSMPDGSFRFHANGEDYGGMCILGTFSERAVISEHSLVKVHDWLPLETAVLVGCGVPTGWGTGCASSTTSTRPATVRCGWAGSHRSCGTSEFRSRCVQAPMCRPERSPASPSIRSTCWPARDSGSPSTPTTD